MIVVIDNFDSFTYNIVDIYRGLDSVEVLRNNVLATYNFEKLRKENPLIVISPGPRSPEETPTLRAFLDTHAHNFAIFGVCLGAQLIAHHFGANIIRAEQVFHGKVSKIHHYEKGVFSQLPTPLAQTRYHSLLIASKAFPECLDITARTQEGEIMAIRHKSLPIEGVQFHPESIASEHGARLLKNSLELRKYYKRDGRKDSITSYIPTTPTSISTNVPTNVPTSSVDATFTHDRVNDSKAPDVTPSDSNQEGDIRKAIRMLIQGQRLSADLASSCMYYMSKPASDKVLMTTLLTALKIRGESSVVVSSFAQVLHQLAIPFFPHSHNEDAIEHDKNALDIVGTGGDGHNTVNISTGVALLLSAMGIPIIKHGNKAVSSKSGSADVLTALGFDIMKSPKEAYHTYSKHNFAFLYAPLYHPALKHIASVRASMKISTIFNILGPLVNPARPSHMLLGVYAHDIQDMLAQAVKNLYFNRVAIVCSSEYADELTLGGPNRVIEIYRDAKGEHSKEYSLTPEELEMPTYPISALVGGNATFNALILQHALKITGNHHNDALDGENFERMNAIDMQAIVDTLCLNAGMGLYIYGKTQTIKQGVQDAKACIASNGVTRHLQALIHS